jgi:ribosomal protein L27
VGMGVDHTLFAKSAGKVQFGIAGEAKRHVVSIVPA